MLNFETECCEILNNVLHNQKKERSGNTILVFLFELEVYSQSSCIVFALSYLFSYNFIRIRSNYIPTLLTKFEKQSQKLKKYSKKIVGYS